MPLVPSHCDPVPENILDNGTRLFLIDWEYAGMNDPAWDLAYLALEGGLGPDDESAMLAAYADPAVTTASRSTSCSPPLWALLWSVLQAGTAEARRFAEWGTRRLETAEALAKDPRLPLWMQDIV